MLEDGGSLLTWSLAELPTPGGPAVAATRLANHRLAYLDYEGPVSGERGEVKRFDAGDFSWVERKNGALVVEMVSEMLRGQILLDEFADRTWRVRYRFASLTDSTF
jgi:hypothetical protein